MEEKYISVSGIRTRYLEAGSGDPIVLVHGGEFGRFANANDWEPIIAPLAEDGFRVLALDKIGNGFSAIDLFLKNAPRAEAHVFSQAGHYVYREQPQGLVRVLKDYIRRVHASG